MIGPEALKAIDEGARYSALLAPIVHAYICEDEAELNRLLDAVDPIEATLTANKLRVVSAYHAQDRGVTSAATDAAGPDGPSVVSLAPRTSATEVLDGALDEQASAPTTYPEVVHAFDNWSRKVPCR